ncbi:MAG: GNAT family N-acetyltransferase [Butyrivibrio sp.]|nr:GNAT family N-acetyltransferase [Butyrivibrio sp.]
MSLLPEYRQIEKKELESFKELILPDIYEELCDQEEIDTEYICISSWMNDTPVGAIIVDPEGSGDLNLLSIWTVSEYRRMGFASALLDKALQVAAALFDYEEGQYGDDITLKTMYCLGDEYKEPFEEWLKKNDFTEFGILKPTGDGKPEVCSASADIHFFRTIG